MSTDKDQSEQQTATTSQTPPLLPIFKMESGLIAQLNAAAVRQNARVVLRNGLILNDDGKGRISHDLKRSAAFNEQWAREYDLL